tara:strand:- start:2322 stop:3257 length:936 start_codon:yes stop_codon:yes gene_type:complete
MGKRNKMELKDKLEQHDIKHFSASQLNIPLNLWWFKYVKLTAEERKKIEFGVAATSGNAIHDALDLSLQNVNPNTFEYDQETIDLIFDEIGNRIDEHVPVNENDELKIQGCKEHSPKTAQNMLDATIDVLKERRGDDYKETSHKTFLEGNFEQQILWQPKELVVPIIGYADMLVNNPKTIIEYKTLQPRLGAVKKDGSRGFSVASIPVSPRITYLEQITVYWEAMNREYYPIIIVGNKNKSQVFHPENCQEMSFDNMEIYSKSMIKKAKIRQSLLMIDNPINVLDIPDFETDFYWNIGKELEDKAKELWLK